MLSHYTERLAAIKLAGRLYSIEYYVVIKQLMYYRTIVQAGG